MAQGQKDLPFKLDIAEVVLFSQNGLVQDLHRIVRANTLLFLLDEKYFGEAAFAQQADNTNRPQVNLMTEILWSIWSTSLHDIVIEGDAFLYTIAMFVIVTPYRSKRVSRLPKVIISVPELLRFQHVIAICITTTARISRLVIFYLLLALSSFLS